MLTLAQAQAIVDTAISCSNHWFLPNTRERAIEAAWNGTSRAQIIDRVEHILSDGKCLATGDDPHDDWSTRNLQF